MRDNCTPWTELSELSGGGRETRTPSEGYPEFTVVDRLRRLDATSAVTDNCTLCLGRISASGSSGAAGADVSFALEDIIKR